MQLESEWNRRRFLGAGVVGALAIASKPVLAAADEIRVGLIGCGGRGTGAVQNALRADANVRIAALGDLFEDQIRRTRTVLENQVKKDGLDKQWDVTDERCFIGLDAYRKVLESGVDVVILAAPGGFRPLHLKAAIDFGKHVFAEKPVAVDVAGYLSVRTSAESARKKNLSVVAGFQRRHNPLYQQAIDAIRAGAIGKIVSGEAYWKGTGLWVKERQPTWSELEWQVRNWLYFSWLSGDLPVELLSHNLDVINWAVGSKPLSASGTCSRKEWNDPKYGNAFDNFKLDFEYPGGIRVHAEASQLKGGPARVTEILQGEKGTCEPSTRKITGENARTFPSVTTNPYDEDFKILIRSIRAGRAVNELDSAADSSMTAILGRMAAYRGQSMTWDEAIATGENLMPARLEDGLLPAARPPVVASPSKRADDPTLYALLVGCSEYDEKELRSLQFSRNDVDGLQKALRSAGFAERNIVLMHDKQAADLLPEARKIRKQLNLVLGGLRPDDTVVVAFAGHGVQFKGEKESYFCPRDAEIKDRSTLIDLKDVYRQLDACRARRKLLLVDACRNDPLSDLARSRASVDLESVTRPQTESVPEGIVALFSCSAGQRAYEHPDLKHGVFFHHVIEALSGGAADKSGDVTLSSFLNYVQRETQTYARIKLQALQVPQQKNDFSGEWVLQPGKK